MSEIACVERCLLVLGFRLSNVPPSLVAAAVLASNGQWHACMRNSSCQKYEIQSLLEFVVRPELPHAATSEAYTTACIYVASIRIYKVLLNDIQKVNSSHAVVNQQYNITDFPRQKNQSEGY